MQSDAEGYLGFKRFRLNFGICVDYCPNGVLLVLIFVDSVARLRNDDFRGRVTPNDKGYITCLLVGR